MKAYLEHLSRHPWAVVLILVGVFALLYFMRRGFGLGREGMENGKLATSGAGAKGGESDEPTRVVADEQMPADTSHITIDKINLEETLRPKRSNSVPVRKQQFESNDVLPATEGMLGKGFAEGFCSSCAAAY